MVKDKRKRNKDIDKILCKLRTIFYLPPRFADYQK